MANAMRDVAIVGVAESDLGVVPDKSKFQLSAEASRAALDDAGLSVKDVDGLFTTIITEGGQFSRRDGGKILQPVAAVIQQCEPATYGTVIQT